ncbi:SSI family serine proteinase inhibitor [Streptomyces sp. MAR4 CNX-425]|uniref:SSI family serine proteinase inhibitor n=1 Tax=Streptomyces sp. MAR4 CNX-425 TaxID=3406343 RepID=UPI003B50D659
MTVRPFAAVLAATAVAAATAATAVLLPPTAAARPLPEPFDATHLRLTTTYVNSADRAKAAFTYLNCDPAGGSHPAAESACTDLAAVDGRFEELGDKEGVCTMQYEPVELRATGTWHGEPVDYVSEVFANPCTADLATGGNVFHF